MNTNENADLKRLQRLLKEIVKVAEMASMSGAFDGGAADAVEKYNLILSRLVKRGVELDDLFPPLPPDASFDRVGVAAKLLSSFIVEETHEGFASAPQINGFHIHVENLGKMTDLEGLKKLIQENLPEWASGKVIINDTGQEESETATVRVTEPSIPMPDLSRTTAS